MSSSPCVLLISPGILKWTDMDFGLPHLVALGGWLREKTGVRVEILDLNYEGGDHKDLLRTIDSLGPHLVIGLSTYSSFDVPRVMALARFLKDRYPNTPLVTGGYHASALPDDLVFDGSPFDAVVIGEGERPMQEIVETLLGGEALTSDRYGPDLVMQIDELPPYAWDLLDRYWPRATSIGRKLQIYLSRGCAYHCTFCMERAKSGYKWRAFSSDRAVDELKRLAAKTDLSHWVVNVADPLFGFHRRWRLEVLEGIVREGLLPRQYWTLTRSDDLDDDDIDLLARGRFAIGIGLESGSPDMLKIMQKGNKPDRYLNAVRRMARLSHQYGLTWSVNVIVGHPGETPRSMRETSDFITELFTSDPTTRGWLSVDPFRLYPGSAVHEQRLDWERRFGTHFYAPEWWKGWYDHGFHAQHLDPSSQLDFETRARFMHDTYRPLIHQIADRFVGQGREVDRVWMNSIRGQVEALAPEVLDGTLAKHRAASLPGEQPAIRVPLGLHVRNPWVREREAGVRRLLDHGVLRTGDLIEALLQVGPESFMASEDATQILKGSVPWPEAEGLLPSALPLGCLAMGLEALEPASGDVIADLGARTGYVSALLSRLVGPSGWVIAHSPAANARAVLTSLLDYDNVEVDSRTPILHTARAVDRIWLGAALPNLPMRLIENVRADGGRIVTFLGPRFRSQDLVSITRQPDESVDERRIARFKVPVVAGPGGWIAKPAQVVRIESTVRFVGRDEVDTMPAPLQGESTSDPTVLAARARVLIPSLTRLRERLYEPSGGTAPPLDVIDCPELDRATALTVENRRVIGLALSSEPHHVLCEVLCAEIRPITDPLLREALQTDDDQALYDGAVAAMEAFLSDKAPELLHEFSRWKPAAPSA